MPRKPKTSPAKLEAIKRYQSQFDEIKLRVPKGTKDNLLDYAIPRGWESLSDFVLSAVDYTMANHWNKQTIVKDLQQHGNFKYK